MADANLIEKYLSDDEMKEIAVQEWREVCRSNFERRTPEVIISNAAYHIAYHAVEEAVGGDLNEMIVAETKRVISELSSHTVFRAPSVYDREASPAWKFLQEVVKGERAAMEEGVRNAIGRLDSYDLTELLRSSTLSIQFGERK